LIILFFVDDKIEKVVDIFLSFPDSLWFHPDWSFCQESSNPLDGFHCLTGWNSSILNEFASIVSVPFYRLWSNLFSPEDIEPTTENVSEELLKPQLMLELRTLPKPADNLAFEPSEFRDIVWWVEKRFHCIPEGINGVVTLIVDIINADKCQFFSLEFLCEFLHCTAFGISSETWRHLE